MKILHLYVEDYGNLKDFYFQPDNDSQATVVLGRNGTGKSNLFECIVEIFRDLEDRKKSLFSYKLAYEIRGKTIQLENAPRQRLVISVDSEPVSAAIFHAESDFYLPNFIFAYYSGHNSRLEKLFERSTLKLYRSWLGADTSFERMPLRRLVYCRKEYSQLALLSLLSMNEESPARKFLSDFLHIEEFESALVVLQRPDWGVSARNLAKTGSNGDPLFWGARGAIQNFTSRLWRNCLAPIQTIDADTSGFLGNLKKKERHYLFIKDLASLRELQYPGEDESDLFAYLEGLHLSGLLEDIRLTVKHKKVGLLKNFEQLSEGEQQLLTVISMLHVTKGEESLYLLDEPDTHLNPSWTYEYLDLIKKQVPDDSSQMLIASHNPLMIGCLRKEQVRLLNREGKGETTKVSAIPPEQDPIGMGVDGLLQSPIFGLQSVLAPEIRDRLTERYQLLGIRNKTAAMAKQLETLTKELDGLGITHTFTHPYFNQFSQALARHKLMQEPNLSPEEIEELADISDEFLQDIIDGKQPEPKA